MRPKSILLAAVAVTLLFQGISLSGEERHDPKIARHVLRRLKANKVESGDRDLLVRCVRSLLRLDYLVSFPLYLVEPVDDEGWYRSYPDLRGRSPQGYVVQGRFVGNYFPGDSEDRPTAQFRVGKMHGFGWMRGDLTPKFIGEEIERIEKVEQAARGISDDFWEAYVRAVVPEFAVLVQRTSTSSTSSLVRLTTATKSRASRLSRATKRGESGSPPATGSLIWVSISK